MSRSRSAVDAGVSVVCTVTLAAWGSACALADAVPDALDEAIDLAESVAVLEEILGSSSDDSTDLLETLLRDAAALRAAPLDVNRATFADLIRIPLIDAATAVAIIERRNSGAPLTSIEELEGVAGLRSETVRALRAYLVVGETDGSPVETGGPRSMAAPGGAPADDVAGLAWSLRVRGTTRQSEVHAAGGDLGDAAATRVRFRVSNGRLEAGVGCQKDAGERDLLDHSAFFIGWTSGASESNAEHRASVIAGDFVGSWGQGIVVSSSFIPGVEAFPRIRDRTRGYDGASESTARRGLVVEVSRGRARVTAVASRTRLDAAIDELGRATTIRTSGYHRTEGERRGANALRESLFGVRAVVGLRSGWEIGGSLLRFRYDPPLASADVERQRFHFEGEDLEVRAADVRFASGSWRFGAEVASTSSGGPAALACARVRRGAATVHLGFGHLSRDYWSPLGGGVPGFSSGGNGIVGWIGAAYRVAPRVKPWIRLAVGGRPWRSYSDELPGGFRRWSAGLAMPVGRLGDLEAEVRERASADERGDPPASVDEVSRTVRATFRPSRGSPLSVFLERTSVAVEDVEDGASLAIGVRTEVEIARSMSLAAGVTQSVRRGRTRPLVQYEPSLPGEFGLRSLSESGARWYARVVAGLTQHFGLSLRIGGGPGRDRTEIGVAFDTRGS